MKRTLVLVFAAILAGAFATTASAVPVGLGTFELTAGYAKSSTEVSLTNDPWGGGLTFGAGYWRGVSPSVSWGAEVSYDNLGIVEWNNMTDNGETSGSVFRVNPAVRFSFGAPVGPSFFAQGGAGIYNVSSEFKNTNTTTGYLSVDGSDSKFGYNVGAGVNFPVGPKTKMNFQGNYHSVSTDGESTNYVTFRAGLGFGL